MHLGVGDALLLQLRQVLLLVALEVLLLQALELILDLLVGDGHAERRRLLLQLDALDEALEDLRLDRLVFGRAGFRERALLEVVAALRLAHSAVEGRARDVLAADDGRVRLREGGAATTAARGGEQGKREREEEQREAPHRPPRVAAGLRSRPWVQSRRA